MRESEGSAGTSTGPPGAARPRCRGDPASFTFRTTFPLPPSSSASSSGLRRPTATSPVLGSMTTPSGPEPRPITFPAGFSCSGGETAGSGADKSFWGGVYFFSTVFPPALFPEAFSFAPSRSEAPRSGPQPATRSASTTSRKSACGVRRSLTGCLSRVVRTGVVSIGTFPRDFSPLQVSGKQEAGDEQYQRRKEHPRIEPKAAAREVCFQGGSEENER